MKVMKESAQGAAKRLLRAASWNWKPYSRLMLYGENAGWSLDWDMRELGRISRQLDIRLASTLWKHAAAPQSIFFSSQFFLTTNDWMKLLPHRIGFSYFHGKPNSGDALFDSVYKALCRHHEQITRVQVSHKEMLDVTLGTGIDPSRVFMIPIGINLNYFSLRNAEQKTRMRDSLGIPQTAFVIGSLQKDGVGWGEGLEPKLIKGPDVFLSTLQLLKKDIPEMFVLLSGPARGYVKQGLEKMKIPYKHVFIKNYPEISRLFQTLDVYLVASRQEGGPKAILESMASGVPIITTRVGQAMDLVKHGENGWIADVEDAENLARYILHVHGIDRESLMSILAHGRATAVANSYESQLPLWADFMKGFVEARS